MSTLNPSEAVTSLAWDVAARERDEQLPRQAAFIPRSAIDGGVHHHQASSVAYSSSQLDTQGYHNLNIDIPLNNQSSMSMELTHDGKVTELVARFESYAGYSDASEVSTNDRAGASSVSTHCLSHSDVGTGREPPDEHVHFKLENPPVGHTKQGQHSPRKPIPSQWLAKSNGPNLATAQRAKERSHKKGSQSGSPIDVKTLRRTRSSVDLGKTHSTEGSTFLTKEALAAVQSNIISPTSPRSPSRLHRSPSKPSWQSPNASPLHSSLGQQSTLAIKLSPTRPTYLSADPASNEHSRASSSIATSTGGNSFHTAEGSPVRSPADSELSFRSAAEILEDVDIPHLDLTADSENVQALQGLSNARLSTLHVKTEGKTSSIKPRLALKIPPSDSTFSTGHKSVAASLSATSSSETSISPWSPSSPIQASRIPRVAATSKAGNARGATRSSTLKRVQSVKSLTFKAESQHDQPSVSPQLPLLDTPTVHSLHHTCSVNSPGVTPMLSRNPAVDNDTITCNTPLHTDHLPAQTPRQTIDKHILDLNKTALSKPATPSEDRVAGYPPRAPSSATENASPLFKDPVLMDTAIVYSCKNSDTLGTMLNRSVKMPPLIVMMAHALELGKSDLTDASHEHTASVAHGHASAIACNTSPVRGRIERFVPGVRKHAVSEHSLQSSLGSDLRATAPEFIPQATQPTYPSLPTEAKTSDQLDPATILPDLSGLDKHSVPWLYYMYPVQFAYEQGFRNGRSKSPKKSKPRKQHESVSSPTSSQNMIQNINTPVADSIPVATPLSDLPQRQPSAVLMPPPPAPSQRPQEPLQRENSRPSSMMQHKPETTSDTDEPSNPFSKQIDVIAQQAALRNHTNSNNFRFANMDLTTIRNVGLPLGPRNMHAPAYYTVPHRGRRHGHRYAGNGLYGGRGAAGVPMHATVPFPDPVPPQGRPDQNHEKGAGGTPKKYVGYSIGTEACGSVDIVVAAERGGGEACNTCAPGH